MYYKGKLYGKSRGRYFEMEETTEDVDRLKERIKELEALVPKNESLHLVSCLFSAEKVEEAYDDGHYDGQMQRSKIFDIETYS